MKTPKVKVEALRHVVGVMAQRMANEWKREYNDYLRQSDIKTPKGQINK